MPVLQTQSLERRAETVPDYLKPASVDDFRRELTSCLALCAPAGFDEAVRREWLTTAWATLQGIPADLLTRGCASARKYADHPSKIVPSIMREIESTWSARKQSASVRNNFAQPEPTEARPIGEIVTAAQIAEIKAEFGLSTNPYPEQPKPLGTTPRMPTRADYIAMGVDPSVLDALPGREAA
jgi:hypothetical protein